MQISAGVFNGHNDQIVMINRYDLNWKRELLEALLIFLFGGSLNVFVWCTQCFESTYILWLNIGFGGMSWVLFWKGSQYIVRYLDFVLPWLAAPIKRLLISIVSVVTYVILVVYALDLFYDLVILEKPFLESIASIGIGSISTSIYITLGINTVMHGRGFMLAWRQASIDVEKLKTENVSTQYQSLKNQVNPHFLFNSLNALTSLVYDDQAKAVEFIRKLSSVYRYVLEKKDEEIVPLSDELKFMEDFVFLQQIRFGDNLQIDLDDQSNGGSLPPLALQILIENAIKHNVVSEKDPLNIRIKINADYCEISNNIKEKLDKDSTGVGLSNLTARYKYLTHKELEIQNDGNIFTVRLPILKIEE